MKKCGNCGKIADSNFCPNCGKKMLEIEDNLQLEAIESVEGKAEPKEKNEQNELQKKLELTKRVLREKIEKIIVEVNKGEKRLYLLAGAVVIILLVAAFVTVSHFSMIGAIHGVYERSIYTNPDGVQVGMLLGLDEEDMTYGEIAYNVLTDEIIKAEEGEIKIKLLHIELDSNEQFGGTTKLRYDIFTKKFINGENTFTLIED